MHHFHGARLIAGVALLLSLGACSGGGSDNKVSRQIQLSTQSVRFEAAAPDSATPPPAQTVTAVLSEGLANLSVLSSGRGVESITSSINGSTALLTITPSAPNTLGSGIYTTTVAITGYFCADAACSRLEAGASQTLTVTYQISPTVDGIAPNTAIAGVADTAIIRGKGFGGYTISGVKLGSVAATTTTVASDNEIRIAYPALAAGSYPVTIDVPSHQGTITSTATLLVVDAISPAGQALAWPNAVTTVRTLFYDAQHGALIAASDAGGGEVLRYPYTAGAWGTATTQPIANLRDVALSTEGSSLVSISSSQLFPLDPVTLTPGAAVDPPSLASGVTLKNIAFTNLNSAVITTSNGATQSNLYGYVTRTGVLSQLSAVLVSATPGAAGNGSFIAFIQGDPATTSTLSVFTLDASSANIAPSTIGLNQNSVAPIFDRNATRLILNGTNVYDPSFALFGKLPTTTLAVAMRPDGKRAYTYDSAAGALLRFDISATKSGEAYVQLGDAVPLVAAPGANVKMAISPDGNTLFLAGATQIVVQPTPLDP
ncbi:MAG TPA: IPT/TIG domain-containing protein [Povalibacter sp.]